MTISSCIVTTYVQPIDQSIVWHNEILNWLIWFDCIRLLVCVEAQTLWRRIVETWSVKYTWPVSPCRRPVQMRFYGRNICNLSNIWMKSMYSWRYDIWIKSGLSKIMVRCQVGEMSLTCLNRRWRRPLDILCGTTEDCVYIICKH